MAKFKKIASILTILVVLTSMLGGCGGTNESSQQSNNAPTSTDTTQPAEPVKIRALLNMHPWKDTMQANLAQFEKETGIQVELEALTQDQLSSKISVELTAGSDSLDVLMIRPLQEFQLFVLNGWIENLEPFIAGDQSIDIQDYTPTALESFKYNGQVYGLPLTTERTVMYYRKDKFEELGIKVPETIEELREAASKLTNKDEKFYGIVMRGKGAEAVTQFSPMLASFGGQYFDKDGKASLDSPEAIEAMTFYGSLLKDFGPPGVVNMSWEQASALFAQGSIGMYLDADTLVSTFLDEKSSVVADKVAYAPYPVGKVGKRTPNNVCSQGFSVASVSKKKEAAYKFIAWATGKSLTQIATDAGFPGSRTSVWNNAKPTEKFPQGLLDEIRTVMSEGISNDRPAVIHVQETRDAIGKALVTAITGGDVASEMKTANQKLQEIYDADFKK